MGSEKARNSADLPSSAALPRISDGSTRLLAIIGDPIAQARAPAVWSSLLRSKRLNTLCLPFHWAPQDLAAALAALATLRNLDGVIITIPHKPAAARLATTLTPRARQVGAANILRREGDGWAGDIIDGVGFVAALAANGRPVRGRSALVVGAGGVGAAIAFALAEAGADLITLSDVDAGRAEALAGRLVAAGFRASVGAARGAGHEVVVNATPLGMRADDPLPIDPDGMTADTIAGEVIMSPAVTPWMRAVRERGCFVQPGSELMDYGISEMAAFLGFSGDWSIAAVRKAGGA